MKTVGCAKWYNVYDLLNVYISNEKMKMLSFQNEAYQFLNNVQISFHQVEVNPLELFLLKRWATKVDILTDVPSSDLQFILTGYADIDDATAYIQTTKDLIMDPQQKSCTQVDKLYQGPLYGIQYIVNVFFKGTRIFNILGTAPLVHLDPRLRVNLGLFKEIYQSKLVSQFLIDRFRQNFLHMQESYFTNPDIFTDAVVYSKYLKTCPVPQDWQLPREFFIRLSHIQYETGSIHFLNTDQATLQAELDQYHSELVNGYIDPKNNEYVILVTSSLKVFFGFCLYTDWITANESWLVTMGNCKPQKQLFSKSFRPESMYHQTMVERLHASMNFLSAENARKEEENGKLMMLGKYEQQTLAGQIYSMLPGTSTMHYMLRIRGDESLIRTETSSTSTTDDTYQHPVEALGYLDGTELQQLAKLISKVEKSLNTV